MPFSNSDFIEIQDDGTVTYQMGRGPAMRASTADLPTPTIPVVIDLSGIPLPPTVTAPIDFEAQTVTVYVDDPEAEAVSSAPEFLSRRLTFEDDRPIIEVSQDGQAVRA